jgi:hypothetical protein
MQNNVQCDEFELINYVFLLQQYSFSFCVTFCIEKKHRKKQDCDSESCSVGEGF